MRHLRRLEANIIPVLLLAFAFGALARGQGFPGHWKARWIWVEGEPKPFHFFLMARRSVDLEAMPRAALLHITAADRYVLYVNGQYLGRGPARSDPRWKSYDTYDVLPRLRAGKNTIAVLAYHYGCSNNYSRDERAGLFVQAEITGADDRRWVIGTDEEWRVRPAHGWRRDVEQINSAVGVTEVYDANADPPDWTSPDFEDSLWQRAYVIPDAASPWNYLEPRWTPMMEEKEIFPARVVSVGEVIEVSRVINGLPGEYPGEAQVPERLAMEIYSPLQHAKIENPEALLKGEPSAARIQSFPPSGTLPGNVGRRSPYLIVDFGRQVFGFPRVRLDGPSGGVVEMTYAPELVAGRVLPFSQGVRYGDRYVMRAGKQVWQTFEYKQFRYLLVVFRNMPASVSVASISLNSYNYPAPRKGSFECSDPMLNKLWKACIDTVYLQMEDALVADAVRERRVFTLDGGHGLWPIWAAFGDVAISDWYFRLITRGTTLDGMLREFYAGTERDGIDDMHDYKNAVVYENPVLQNIPQGGLVVASLFGEYYQYFGKRKLAEDIYPALANLANWFGKETDESGLAYNLPYWNWVDWVKTDMRGANFETNALYCRTLEVLAQIAKDLGKSDEASVWQTRAEKVKTSLRKSHWNDQQQLYVDSVLDGKQSITITETANGMAILWGIATPEQTKQIVRRLADPKTGITRSSPLFFAYTMEGLIKAGAIQTALGQMRERYAAMMEYSDNPTLWEAWDRTPGSDQSMVIHSGTGPAWILSRHILGVAPQGVGFQQCRIEPKTAGLSWARGVFPSVRGDIKVDWKKAADRFSIQVELPAGLETEIVVPRDPSRNLRISHSGRQVTVPAGATSVPGLSVYDNRVGLRVTGGSHHVESFND